MGRTLGVALCLAASGAAWADAEPLATIAEEDATAAAVREGITRPDPSGQASVNTAISLAAWPDTSPGPAWLGAAARRVGDNGLYAYLDLSPSLPWRMHKLLGKPEGGFTLERRPGSGLVGQLGLGSVMRWHLGDSGQIALRWRGGRMALQYGLKFNL